jgi:hypothetical protein
MRPIVSRLTVLAAGAALLIASGGTAQALGSNPTPTTTPGQQVVVIDPHGPGVTTTANGTFYPTGHLPANTLTVVPDDNGNFPGGLTAAQIRQTVKESGVAGLKAAVDSRTTLATASAATVTPMSVNGTGYSAIPSVWSAPHSGPTVWGTVDTKRTTYIFDVTAETNQNACGQGTGYYQGYNGSQFGLWSAWYGLGCATSNSDGSNTVP